MKKQVLWLCNIVLPDFSQEFGIKKNKFGGWITGMLHQLQENSDYDISLCFPIRDSNRLRNGICGGHKYYSFLTDMSAAEYSEEMVSAFVGILQENEPEIIHIWGTEYAHTRALIEACARTDMLKQVVINIQGLVSVCAQHYLKGIPEEYRVLRIAESKTLEEKRNEFVCRGYEEIESIQRVSHVIGRTDWDRAWTKALNPRVQYYFVNEILRDEFYKAAKQWKQECCVKHSIFVSQASYPIKGFHFLLQAMPMIIEEFSDVHITVAGVDILENRESPYALFLQSIIVENHLEDYITFVGVLSEEEMIRQYLEANVFVSPSTIENSSNSVCEALQIGVPVVASYVGGTGNLIAHGRNGYLYPVDEVTMLAYYVSQVFHDELLMDFEHRYNEKEIAKEQLLICYDNIVNFNE